MATTYMTQRLYYCPGCDEPSPSLHCEECNVYIPDLRKEAR